MSPPKISIIIVSYNVSDFLNNCLISVKKALSSLSSEIFVVDNASTDGTQEMIQSAHSDVRFIANSRNVGFGRANNMAISKAQGEFVCLINPDVVVSEDTFSQCIAFLNDRPKTGLLTCRVLKPDGTLDIACRRSFPSPKTAFYRFIGISRLFPKSPEFGKYNLLYLDENETHPVDAISGSFMFFRGKALTQVKGFDPDYFMYGEDLDICHRLKSVNWLIEYFPKTSVVHFGARSSGKRKFRARLAFYRAMYVFSKKHLDQHISFFPRLLVYLGIFLNAIFQTVFKGLFKIQWVILDLVTINTILFSIILVRFNYFESELISLSSLSYAMMHLAVSAIFIFSLGTRGIYSSQEYSLGYFLRSLAIASFIFFSITFFLAFLAFSRIAFLVSCFMLALVLPSMRLILDKKRSGGLFFKKRVAILGEDDFAIRLSKKVQKRPEFKFVGFISRTDPGFSKSPNQLGHWNHFEEIIDDFNIQEIILASENGHIPGLVEIINKSKTRPISLKIARKNPYGDSDSMEMFDINLALSKKL